MLYMGAMGEANNIDVILNAASMSQDSNLLFLLVGDGMKRAAIKQRIADSGMSNVQCWEPVAKSEVRQCISAADLCVVSLQDIPLFQGAIPTKLLDYMACGKPVLCGVRGEAAQIVEEADAGVIFAPNDGAQLAALIQELMADESRRLRMGANGAAYILKNFEARKSREAMENLLLDVVGQRAEREVA